MRNLIAAAIAAAFVMGTGSALAGDIKGVIKGINGNARTVTIDGVTYYFPQNVDMNGLAGGQTVTLTFNPTNGRNQVAKVTK